MNGLVIAGGNSSRMGTDKAFLQYSKNPQYQEVYSLLEPFCEQTFVSLQNKNDAIALPQISLKT